MKTSPSKLLMALFAVGGLATAGIASADTINSTLSITNPTNPNAAIVPVALGPLYTYTFNDPGTGAVFLTFNSSAGVAGQWSSNTSNWTVSNATTGFMVNNVTGQSLVAGFNATNASVTFFNSTATNSSGITYGLINTTSLASSSILSSSNLTVTGNLSGNVTNTYGTQIQNVSANPQSTNISYANSTTGGAYVNQTVTITPSTANATTSGGTALQSTTANYSATATVSTNGTINISQGSYSLSGNGNGAGGSVALTGNGTLSAFNQTSLSFTNFNVSGSMNTSTGAITATAGANTSATSVSAAGITTSGTLNVTGDTVLGNVTAGVLNATSLNVGAASATTLNVTGA